MEWYYITLIAFFASYLLLGIITSYLFYKNMPDSYKEGVPSWWSVRKAEVIIEVFVFPILWFGLFYKFLNKVNKVDNE